MVEQPAVNGMVVGSNPTGAAKAMMRTVKFYNTKKVHETEKAILFRIADKECWIPKSHIVRLAGFNTACGDGLEITEWIAIKKGLEFLIEDQYDDEEYGLGVEWGDQW